MAMNPEAPPTVEVPSAVLTSATAALRAHTDGRWVEVSRGMLSGILSRSRSSYPVRAQAPMGPFSVSEHVLVMSLQCELDSIPRCEVTGIQIDASGDTYTGVTIVVTAQYPDPLIPLADRLRDAAQRRLREVLGAVIPEVTVSAMHVHVADISRTDPKRG